MIDLHLIHSHTQTMKQSLILMFMLLQLGLGAQIFVFGRITDAKSNDPIPYASVVYGHTRGTNSDLEGHYRLTIYKIEGISTLQISCIGYVTQQIDISSIRIREQVDIQLEPARYLLTPFTVYERELTPFEMIQLALSRIEENYVTHDRQLIAIYKEQVIEQSRRSGRTSRTLTAGLLIEDPGYSKRLRSPDFLREEVYIMGIDKGVDSIFSSNSPIRFLNQLNNRLTGNWLRYRSGYLSKSRKYDYTIVNRIADSTFNSTIYQIRITHKDPDSYYPRFDVYVNNNNFQIERIEMLPREKIYKRDAMSYAPGEYFRHTEDVFVVVFKYNAEKKLDLFYICSHITVGHFLKENDSISLVHTYHSEITIIEEPSERLDTSEMIPMNKKLDIYRQDETVDKKFWERFNIF
jgi:hypothetical protein